MRHRVRVPKRVEISCELGQFVSITFRERCLSRQDLSKAPLELLLLRQRTLKLFLEIKPHPAVLWVSLQVRTPCPIDNVLCLLKLPASRALDVELAGESLTNLRCGGIDLEGRYSGKRR